MSECIGKEQKKFLTGLIGNVDNLLSEISKLNTSLANLEPSDMRGTLMLDEVIKLESRVEFLINGNKKELAYFIKNENLSSLSKNPLSFISLVKG